MKSSKPSESLRALSKIEGFSVFSFKLNVIRIRPAVTGLLLALVLFTGGCKNEPPYQQIRLPLPPTVDNRIVEGQYVQADYGFGISLPPKWILVRYSEDQDLDEVARFTDERGFLTARLGVEELRKDQKFSLRVFESDLEKDLTAQQLTVVKKEKPSNLKTVSGDTWWAFSNRAKDARAKEWQDRQWVLNRGDLLIAVRVTLPASQADSDKGRKFLKEIEGGLPQIKWYTPIGPRGISIDRYELQRFTEAFGQALVSRSPVKVNAFFNDMYPAKRNWDAWYNELIAADDPKSFELEASLTGLIIKGDDATASFVIARKNRGEEKPHKFDKAFHLSKREGSWKILSPAEKK
jgi:hypothetical protein